MMSEIVTDAVHLRCPARRAFDLLADAANWPKYAVHNVLSICPGTDGGWIMQTPRGEGWLRLHADARRGILDHEFIDAQGSRWVVPARVVPVGVDAVFPLTLARPPQVSEEDFARGMTLLEEDLRVLKGLLESVTGRVAGLHDALEAGARGVIGVKRLRVNAGSEGAFEALFGELRARVRRDQPGNLCYDLCRSPDDRGRYVVVERYVDRAALAAHQDADNGAVYFPKIRALPDHLEVEYFDDVEDAGFESCGDVPLAEASAGQVQPG